MLSSIFKLFGAAASASVVARVLVALVISFVTFVGIDSILTIAMSSIQDLFIGLPGDALALFGMAHFDFAINLTISAYSARLAMFAARQMRLFS